MYFIEKISRRKCLTCVIVLVFGMEISGFYFLVQSFLDPKTEEVSEISQSISNWNNVLEDFKSLNITLGSLILSSNITYSWPFSSEHPEYEPFFYSSNSPLVSSDSVLNYSSTSKSFNITLDLNLTVDFNNSLIISPLENIIIHTQKTIGKPYKLCISDLNSYWDGPNQKCLLRYNTYFLCLVVDKTFKIVSWYQKGCDNTVYYKQQETKWFVNDTISDFMYNIQVEIRHANDPLVYAYYHDLIRTSPSSKEFAIIGGVLIAFSSVFLIILCISCFKKKPVKYLNFNEDNTKNKI